MADGIVQIFAKAPVAGQVKTRLIPALGVSEATDLARRLLIYALQQFTPYFTVQLWCTPDPYHPFFIDCQQQFPTITLHTQQGAELGARMAYALGSTGNTPTVLIGSDCPSLTVVDIQLALQKLVETDAVVLAPAEDGGYVLVGMCQVYPAVFTQIAWSTPHVLTQTRQRLAALQVPYWELPTRWDVDRVEDIARFNRLVSDLTNPSNNT